VRLVELSQDFKVGDTITLTLNFEKAGSMTVEAPVKEQ
jgi:copper(I)-binding protein